MADGWRYGRRYTWLSSLCRSWVLVVSIAGIMVVTGVRGIIGFATNLYIYLLVHSLLRRRLDLQRYFC